MRAIFTAVFSLLITSTALAQQQPCTGNAAQIVDDVYKQVLDRPAGEGSAAYTQQLVNGAMTVRQIVADAAKSREYRERFFHGPVIEAVYRQVMQRSATDEEKRYAAAEMAEERMSVEDLVVLAATRSANNNPNGVALLYRRLLGREPDQEGLRGYQQLAEREGIGAVARVIVRSPEYQEANRAGELAPAVQPLRTAVGNLYRRILAREPDPEGLASLTEAAAQHGIDAIVDRMVASPEYQQQFGDHGVPGPSRQRFCR